MPLLPGLQPQVPGSAEPQGTEAANRLSRKKVQMEHLQAYDNSIVSLKHQVEDLEGQDMRDVIQDRVGGGAGLLLLLLLLHACGVQL